MAEIFNTVILSEELIQLKLDIPLNPEFSLLNSCGSVNFGVADDSLDVYETSNIQRLKDEAYQLGFDQGIAQHIVMQEKKIKEQANSLTTLLEKIPQALQENRQQMSNEIADIVLQIVQAFFMNQQHNKEAITLQVSQIINTINDKQTIELFLHPTDIALLQQETLKQVLTQCNNLRVIPDEHLRLGGCKIRTEHSLFNLSIERQIDDLKKVLLQIKQGSVHE